MSPSIIMLITMLLTVIPICIWIGIKVNREICGGESKKIKITCIGMLLSIIAAFIISIEFAIWTAIFHLLHMTVNKAIGFGIVVCVLILGFTSLFLYVLWDAFITEDL